MEWKPNNYTRSELEKRQAEYIKEALRMAKKAKPPHIPAPKPDVTAKPKSIPAPKPEVAVKPKSMPMPKQEVVVKPKPIPMPKPEVAVKPKPMPMPKPEVSEKIKAEIKEIDFEVKAEFEVEEKFEVGEVIDEIKEEREDENDIGDTSIFDGFMCGDEIGEEEEVMKFEETGEPEEIKKEVMEEKSASDFNNYINRPRSSQNNRNRPNAGQRRPNNTASGSGVQQGKGGSGNCPNCKKT